MSNDTNGTCYNAPLTLYIFDQVYFFTYHILTPAYFFIGLIGHAILLAAFRKQAKTEQAYFYQIFVVMSKALESVAFSSLLIPFKLLCKFETEGVEWFRKSYITNFYVAYLGFQLGSIFMTLSLLASVSMAADRVSCMLDAVKYKNKNHKAYELISIIICLLISVSISSFECFGFFVAQDEKGDYTFGMDNDILGQQNLIGVIKGQLFRVRSVVRFVGVITLISLNVVLLVKFRERSKKVASMTINYEQEKSRKSADKALLQLTVCQSVLTCVAHIPSLAYFLAETLVENWMGPGCIGSILGMYMDTLVMISESTEFFVVILVSKKMRRMIAAVLPEFCRRAAGTGSTSQAPVSQNTSRRM